MSVSNKNKVLDPLSLILTHAKLIIDNLEHSNSNNTIIEFMSENLLLISLILSKVSVNKIIYKQKNTSPADRTSDL